MLSHFAKNRSVIGVFIGILVTIICSVGIFANLFSGLNLRFTDSLFTINTPTNEIVIVAIDSKSTDTQEGLKRFSQWGRDYYADLITAIEGENPKVIAFDLIFDSHTSEVPRQEILELEEEVSDKNNKEKLNLYEDFVDSYSSSLDNPVDKEFSDKLSEKDNVILAASISGENLVEPIYQFKRYSKLGVVSAPIDEDGIIRRVQPQIGASNKIYDDFAVAVVKEYLGTKEVDLPEDEIIRTNFFADPNSYKYISFVDAMRGDFEYGTFKDKIVLVGLTKVEEGHDTFYTPKSNETGMPGVEFRANEIQTILEGKYLQDQGKFAQILTIAAISVALTIALNYLGIIAAILLTIISLIAYLLTAHAFYDRGIILNMVYPFVAIVLSYLGSWVYKFFIADKGKREMKDAFSHYVSDKLVDSISENPDSVHLGGEKREITIFFSDIKGSTTYSEQIDTEKWVAQMNEYFTVMEKVIKKYDGTIDKYEGDAIMGFWNAPITQENHQELAYRAAFGMKAALGLLHEKWKKEGKPLIEFRIGINTGQAIVGNFGSTDRFDYTAMGDTVNTASRLEGSANKSYGTKMVISTESNEIDDGIREKFLFREIDLVFLPGKNEPERLYELVSLIESATEDQKNLVVTYGKALQLYREGNFAKALKYFQSLGEDNPSKIMAERCEILASGAKIAEVNEEYVFRIANK